MKRCARKHWREAVSAILVLTVALSAAACGDDQVSTAASGPAGGQLKIAGWSKDFDPRKETASAFEAETGVSVEYDEEVAENGRFLEEVEPMLKRGKSGGSSIFIVTDWMAKTMYERGYLQEISHDDLPTVFKSLRPKLRSPAFDPERKFSVPWQSSMTGLWLNLPRALSDSVVEFFDPDIAGEVTMVANMRESIPIVLQAENENPFTATTADWLDAINRIEVATDVGQIGGLTGSEYTDGLNSGKLLGAVGPSIDAPLIENPKVKWVKPAQGCVLSSENMVIPIGAPNTAAALAWMNYVYRPRIAAGITEYAAGVSPVIAAKKVLERRGSELAQDPLRFPDKKVIDDCADQTSPPDFKYVSQVWREALED